MKARLTGLLRSTMIVSLFTMGSRVLGFIRDMVVAAAFGASPMMDAFLIAFKIPNFMRRLFAEGAFSQAFVPILSEYQEADSDEKLKAFLSVVSGTLATILLALVIIVELSTPFWIRIFAPGFEVGSERFIAATYMLRWTFPYLGFISIAAFTGAVLNSFSKFAVPAATPMLLNITMIAFVLWVCPLLPISIHGLAISIFVAGMIQCLFQWPFIIKMGLSFRPRFGWSVPGVQRLLKRMVPALFGVSIAQINLLMDTVFASFLTVGSIGWLYYSDRLMNFPLGVFGVAISTVILPHLSRAFAAKDDKQYVQSLSWALKTILLIGIPSALGLILLARPLLIVLFNYGHFGMNDVEQSRLSLLAFGLGVPAFMLVKVLASSFYAKHNIETPVKVGAVCMIANLVMNLALITPLKHMGLALATSLASYMNALILIWLLRKREWFAFDRTWFGFLFKIAIAATGMGLFLFAVLQHYPAIMWHQWLFRWRILMLLSVVVIAAILYFAILFVLGYRLKDFKDVSDL